jgi:outer membrane receptor protein involved in Fe transport
MKRLVRISGLGAALVLLGGCSSVSYLVDWDTQQSFSSSGTYAWYELAATPDRDTPPAAPNAIVASRIRRSVEHELAAKGMSPKPAGEADLLVTYHIALSQGMRIYSGGWGYPYRGCWAFGYGWGGGYGSVQIVTEGTLIVDILDGSTRKLVWRGIADGAFTRPNPSDEKVAKVVARLLQTFPPR